MTDPAAVDLPAWAQVSEKRRQHIGRVVALLARWGGELRLGEDERACWLDAGRYHDALRDAPEEEIRLLTAGQTGGRELLHGPAAAARLARDGEQRADVIDAVRYHTVGYPGWGRTGRALYMADFLEPGRPFAREERALLAGQVVNDFDGVFRQVVRSRLDWALREGYTLHPETVALWNSVA